MVAGSGTLAGEKAGQASSAVKRGRGRPRGSKNKATLAREAAAKAAEEGAAPTPVIAAAQPPPGEAKLFDNDLSVWEFVVPFSREGRSRLPLPAQFQLIFKEYIRESVTVREASPQQQLWNIKAEWDGGNRLVQSRSPANGINVRLEGPQVKPSMLLLLLLFVVGPLVNRVRFRGL